ncbi:MAG TPA: hypothetical protein DDX39_06695 [Bacteroidales bacterium]|nr:MAG: hypothetical protein A2W98_11265 [Bacteroidetes bacterium GWF2_33_38]OFY70568.1 MAG: hypothetical protein A2265_11265 [Bacteroidetes bacterium RIFOXYA12_FULL_33_9]OFY86760.1 MAG: hypothetical protein A2236_10405 [Bacteroidetes bacterium RIFOXYA2_FULL_33_7]HBF88315.1 hypothetical protein [Bacteroidales bacterium]
MKKIFFVLALFTSISVFGQMRFGIVGTPQVTWLKSDVKLVETDGIRLGLSYGLNLEFSFSDNAIFTTGVFINNAGGKLKYNDTTNVFSFEHSDIIDTLPTGVSITYKTQYLEIPLGLKFKTNEIGYLTYFGQLGLTPMVNISAKGDSEKPDLIDNEKIQKEVSLFNLAYHIGAGVEYNLSGNTSLLAAIIYTNGFFDITRNPKGNKTTNVSDKVIMNCVSLKVGVLF